MIFLLLDIQEMYDLGGKFLLKIVGFARLLLFVWVLGCHFRIFKVLLEKLDFVEDFTCEINHWIQHCAYFLLLLLGQSPLFVYWDLLVLFFFELRCFLLFLLLLIILQLTFFQSQLTWFAADLPRVFLSISKAYGSRLFAYFFLLFLLLNIRSFTSCCETFIFLLGGLHLFLFLISQQLPTFVLLYHNWFLQNAWFIGSWSFLDLAQSFDILFCISKYRRSQNLDNSLFGPFFLLLHFLLLLFLLPNLNDFFLVLLIVDLCWKSFIIVFLFLNAFFFGRCWRLFFFWLLFMLLLSWWFFVKNEFLLLEFGVMIFLFLRDWLYLRLENLLIVIFDVIIHFIIDR